MRLLAISLVLLTVACGDASETGDGPGSPGQIDQARAMLAADPLPPRANVVALADQLAIAATEAGPSPEAAELAELAAELRERLFRNLGKEVDGREALELYLAAAGAGGTSEAACEAELRRSLLSGEIAQDAAIAFRELYLAQRRRSALEASDECLREFDRAIGAVRAFAPGPEGMAELEEEGNRVAQVAISMAEGAELPPAPGSAIASASASADAPVAPPAAEEQIVVAPEDVDASGGPVKLTAIEPYGSREGARVVIPLTGPAEFKVGALGEDGDADKPPRVYVDIEKTEIDGIPREIDVGGAVRTIRWGERGDGVRVVLDLAKPMFRRVFYLPQPFRIIIDVSERPPRRAPTELEGGRRKIRRVVLDPGHGGMDSGAIGPTGLMEKSVNLDIAHRAAPLLAYELGIETLLTRDSDVYIPLEARTARANASHADLFISIHCNASEDGEAHGIQTYVLDPFRDSSSDAQALAMLENATRVEGEVDAAMSPLGSVWGQALGALHHRPLAEASWHLAALLQRSSLASTRTKHDDVRDGGVRTAGFYVLAGADMPAVLFEASFISHPVEEGRLASADYRQKLADGIVNAVRAFREGK